MLAHGRVTGGCTGDSGLMTLPTTAQVLDWLGLPVHDSAGTAIGSCQNVYADDDAQVPEWVEVALTDDGTAMVPILGADAEGGVVRVAHLLDVVTRSPRFPADTGLGLEDERALYEHYGVPYSTERSSTLLPTEAELPGDPPTTSRMRRIEPPVPTPAAAPAPAPTAWQAPERSTGPDPRLALAALPVAGAGLWLARRRRRRSRLPAELDRLQEQAASRPGALVPLLLAPLGLALLVRRRARRRADAADTPRLVPVAEVVDRRTHTPV